MSSSINVADKAEIDEKLENSMKSIESGAAGQMQIESLKEIETK